MGCSASAERFQKAEVEIAKDFHDEYMIGARLGSGGFAHVYSAKRQNSKKSLDDTTTKIPRVQEFAVKIISIEDEESRENLLKQVNNEVCAWRKVGYHSNCVQLHNIFYGLDSFYMVMDKCRRTLIEHIQQMPDEYNERSLGTFLVQMLQGISHVHSKQIVHRDIKPENVLIGNYKTVKLADFGLAADISETGKTCGINGTAPFMCPEMLEGSHYDGGCDVWSFAGVAYVFLYGCFPYGSGFTSSAEMKGAIMQGTPPKFKPAGLTTRSEAADDFVKTLLDRNPEHRPSAADALQMEYMTSVINDCHMPGAKLPSLKPMLYTARHLGAFEMNYLSESSTEERPSCSPVRMGSSYLNLATLEDLSPRSQCCDAVSTRCSTTGSYPTSNDSSSPQRTIVTFPVHL